MGAAEARLLSVRAWEVLDSRGNPTIAASVSTDSGASGSAMVPSGASTGTREAHELRDGERRYHGKGVLQAIDNIHRRIAPALQGVSLQSQQEIDQRMIELDGTRSKHNLGANAILAVSLACARAAAEALEVPLYRHLAAEFFASGETGGSRKPDRLLMPVPMMNVINGGAHADNGVDIQEFMILPVSAPNIREAVRHGAEVFHALRMELRQQGLGTAVGDEGGFAPNLRANEQAVELLLKAIEQTGLVSGKDMFIGLDVASSEFYRDGKYHLASEGRALDAEGFLEYLLPWVDRYPIISIEDGMAEDDWDGWRLMSDALGQRVQLVGDDLFVTDVRLLEKGMENHIANSILIKPNQIGTLTETRMAILRASDAGYTAVVSHRSGETEDAFIADLAAGTAATQIKTGSLCRSERTAKYNRLVQIEDELGEQAMYAGDSAFFNLSGLDGVGTGTGTTGNGLS